ncbi:MSMB protein, partial [Ciconia maguari]|nr:MSMB protein [Ciconia maguari]
CHVADGELREFGSSWRSDCNDCTCSMSGITCCSSYARPVGYNEEECVSIFNKETCTYEVVEKADHSKACEVQGWM